MTPPEETDTLELLRQTAEWRLMGLLLDCPSPRWSREVAAVANEIRDERLRKVSEAALAQASEGLYHSVFGPGGPASLREVHYHAGVEYGSLMSDLSRFYGAFGYKPLTHEAPDHVAVEAGFIAYLKLKRAFAHWRSQPECVAVAGDAERDFTSRHLSFIAEPLARTLEQSGIEYLTAVSKLLLEHTGPAPRQQVTQCQIDPEAPMCAR